MPELNKVLIAGRLTEDPNIKYTSDRLAVASVKIAVNHYTKDKQESSVSFFDVIAYGRVAEFIREYIKKGNQILVDGKLHQVRYNVKSGTEEKTRSKIEIVANSIFPMHSHINKTIEEEGIFEY